MDQLTYRFDNTNRIVKKNFKHLIFPCDTENGITGL